MRANQFVADSRERLLTLCLLAAPVFHKRWFGIHCWLWFSQLGLVEPIFEALQSGNPAMMEALLEAGCDLDFKAPKPTISGELSTHCEVVIEHPVDIPDRELSLLEVWEMWRGDVMTAAGQADTSLLERYQHCDELLRNVTPGQPRLTVS